MSKSTPSGSGDSQYEYDSEFDADSRDSSNDDESPSLLGGADISPATSSEGQDADADRYLQSADSAMGTLVTLHRSQPSAWKRALKHKSGTVVWVTKESSPIEHKKGGKSHMAPVFKGQLDVKDFPPVSVFGVVGTRKLWDEWYKEGNLVRNLSENSSITYTCMKAIMGSTTRDLSLVEQVQGSQNGTIMFASTSIVTPMIPRVAGRVRASIALNGWVLEPIVGGTRLTYYLHCDVKTFIPGFAAKKYLARRPTCIAKIDEYLHLHGTPPMGVSASNDSVSSAPTSPTSPSTKSFESSPVVLPLAARRSSTISSLTRSSRSRAGSTGVARLPSHVSPDKEAASWGDLEKARKAFEALLQVKHEEWSEHVDKDDNSIWTRKGKDGELIVKGECVVEGVTTEAVLGTLRSPVARKLWDVRFAGAKLVSLDNGFDQGVYVESHKAIYPTLGAHHYIIATSVSRSAPKSPHGGLLLLSRSTHAKAPCGSHAPESTKAQLALSAWRLAPHSPTSVLLTHLIQINPTAPSSRVNSTVEKVLQADYAGAPARLAELIDERGYAPFFVRWGPGPAEVEREEGDLEKGEFQWWIGGEGDGTTEGGQQQCWLQWSERMYERGIALEVEPKGAGTIARVQGVERTVEIVWNDEVRRGARVGVKRADGDGAEDVFVAGEFLDRTVGGETVNGFGKKKERKASVGKLDEGDESRRSTAGDVDAAKLKASGKKNTEDVWEFLEHKAKPQSNGTSAPSLTSTLAGPLAPSQLETTKHSGFPDDACLILSKDLYFTRSQCTFMAFLFFVAFLWGKLG